MSTVAQPFVADVAELRRRAKEHMGRGPVTDNYQGRVQHAIDLLQMALATEVVCVLRYTMHAISAVGIDSEGVKREFEEHANDERQHLEKIADRINQLGGTPNLNPEGLHTRSITEYGNAENLVDMIKENLVAERIAVELYRDLVRHFGDKDPTTRIMIEEILAQEEDHADDMHDLLVAREGKPFLES